MHDLGFEMKTVKEESDYGKFTISPLNRGYGATLGNALRRVLLSSLEGAAAVRVRIEGFDHRFSTLPGLKEDILELLLNIKETRFVLKNGVEEATVKIEKKGPAEVKAGDFELPAGVEVVNKNHVLGNLSDKKAKLKMEVDIKKGYGYSPFEERKIEKIGVLPIDAAFSPVRRVNYKVNETRVGRVTNLDKLVIEVWTDGTVGPKAAIIKAARILVNYLTNLIPEDQTKTRKESKSKKIISVEDLGFGNRVLNILEREGVKTAEDLSGYTRRELLKMKNMGQKSVREIKDKLAEHGLNLKEEK